MTHTTYSVEVIIDKSTQLLKPQSLWERYDTERKVFGTIPEARAWLKSEYGSCGKQKIYEDNERGEAVHVGYIYKLGLQRPSSQGERYSYYEQHWITVNAVRSTPVIITFTKGGESI